MLFVSLAAHAFTYNHQDGNLCYMLIDSYCYVCGVADGVTGKVVVPESIRHKSSVDHKTRTYKVVAVAKDGFSGNSQQGLEELVLPETITEIYSGAFNGCGALKTVNIPSQVTELDNVLNNCPSLTKITIPATVSKLNQILNNSTIEEFIIADSETDLPANGLFSSNSVIKKFYQGRNCTGVSFSNKGIESLVLGDNITEIGYAMYTNNPIQEVTFGKNIIKIGDSAFKSTKLKEISLPESLIELGNNSFDECEFLEMFNIPSKITNLGYNFNKCPSIVKVTIPATVTNISAVFCDCGTIDEFIIADGETTLFAGGWFADNTSITNIYQGRNSTIKFYSKDIESLTVGDYVTEIGENMYSNNPLQMVTFGKNIAKIGREAFKGTQLKNIYFPESLMELGNFAFDNCPLLEKFNIPSNIPELGYNFNNCPSISKITIPASVTNLTAVFGDCGTIDEFIIADGETTLFAGGWFADNTSITNIYQGRNSTIKFYSKDIESLTVGDYVTEIGENMYSSNPLKKVTLGQNLVKIGNAAFGNCDNIEQITVFAENVPVCENNSVFTQNAYDNAKVLVPSGSRKAYAEAPVWKLFKNLGQSTCAVSFEYNAEECALTLPEGLEGSVKNGENLTFNVQPLDGFRIGEVTAEGNCKDLVAGENGAWTLDSIASDITVKIPSEIITYDVKANIDPKTGHITINGEATDSLRVEWGKSAVVDVELYEGYKLNSVKVNGADATLTDGKLTFEAVYEDKTVEIAASLMTYLFTTEFDSECGTVTVGGNTATEQTYTYGSRPEIEVIPNIGYCPSYVRLNGEDIIDRMTDNKFTVDSIKSNMTLNVGFEVRTVMLSVLGLEGGRVATVYDYGETARVKIIPDEDWRINSIIFNGTPIDENELENGLFVTPALTDDSEISVTFEKDNSSVNKVEAGNDIRVYGNNRTIRIENAPEGEPCHIFDVDGRTIYSGTEHIIKMNAGGIYIVAINDRSFKLMLK